MQVTAFSEALSIMEDKTKEAIIEPITNFGESETYLHGTWFYLPSNP